IERVFQGIRAVGGGVIELQRWGQRQLAYEIQRKRDGIYTLILYQGPVALVKEIERRLGLVEQVMRALTMMHVPPELPRSLVEPEAVAAAAAAAEDADE